ncbi:MAG: EF-hand domain-containing protein [Candidatus Sericytochromatia bacterium]
MFKKILSLVTLTTLSFNITACGSDTSTINLATQTVQQPQQAQAQSFVGVYKEVKSASALAFQEMDKNNDRVITADEYGTTTVDGQTSFKAIDKNHDGKITTQEMMTGFFSRVGLTLRLKKAADTLFKSVDRNKDKLVSREEITVSGLSKAYIDSFAKYDVQKKTLFHKDAPDLLSASEFENLYAFVAVNNLRQAPPATTPAPSAGAPEVSPPQTAPNLDVSEDDLNDVIDGENVQA